jgi:glycosyltransferase involved in cell wall biosynthesis
MNLLCVVPSYWPAFQFGGPIYSLHGLNKALVQKGVDITVYTTNVGLEDKFRIKDSGLRIQERWWEAVFDGVKVYYFAYARLLEFLGATGWQFSLPMARALKENVRKFDIVYILSVWNYPVAIASYYSSKFRKPYIISPRGMLYDFTLNKKAWKKLPYYYLIAKRDLKGAAAVHYTTTDEAEKTHSALGLKNKALVIPNGIDIKDYEIRANVDGLRERYPYLKDKKVILFLSRINWKKGLDILVSAYSKLIRERNNLHLLIAGNDEEGYKEKVKEFIKSHGLNYIDSESGSMEYDAQVTFTGMLTGKEKLEVLAGSDIFVLPSYSENFGVAIVEAMACGLPVVISNKVGIYREVQKNNAGIVVDTDVESIYKGMKHLLDNPAVKEEIARNGRKLVMEYYDINNVAERFIDALRELF